MKKKIRLKHFHGTHSIMHFKVKPFFFIFFLTDISIFFVALTK